MNVRLAVKRSIKTYIWMLMIGVSNLWAQDPHFSQFYANPIYTNPAFAGASYVGRLGLNYRSQWPNIAGSYRTFSAAYDEHFNALSGGIGVMATHDEAGVGTLQTTSLNLIYSYQIILSKSLTMRAAVQAGFSQKKIDFSKLTFLDQILPMQGITKPVTSEQPTGSVFYTNFAAGGVIYSNKFYAGFAMHNLTEPIQSFYKSTADESRIKRRYTAHGGLVIPVVESRDPKKTSNLYPNIVYMQQDFANQINLGLYYNVSTVVFGTYFRQSNQTSDAFIFLLGLRTQKVKIGFSYDAVLSKVRLGARQSYEVSLVFELKKKVPRKSVRPIRCPEF